MISLSAVLLRWVTLSALALVIGALALEIVVLPVEPTALDASRGRLRRWVVGGVLLLMATTVGQLMVRAQVMTGGSLNTAIRALPLVLGRTHFGAIWIVRGVLLVAALVAGALPARRGGPRSPLSAARQRRQVSPDTGGIGAMRRRLSRSTSSTSWPPRGRGVSWPSRSSSMRPAGRWICSLRSLVASRCSRGGAWRASARAASITLWSTSPRRRR